MAQSTTATKLTLVSHELCPYVQRAAIVLLEKEAAFERRYVDLSNKADWFLEISPLGKTPVLLVDGQPIFESAVICEYLEDTIPPHLHPHAPLARAQHRAWVEFSSAVLNGIAQFYSAPDELVLMQKRDALRRQFQQLENVLGDGPYFDGPSFSIVDAAFGPVFRYFDVFEQIDQFHFFSDTPKVLAWRRSLAARHSIRSAVQASYAERLMNFIIKKNSALSARCVTDSKTHPLTLN